MPFTPYHLGPALALGLPLRRWLHAPTLLLASVAVDAEPLLVLVLGLSYPLHGYLHTSLLAAPAGLAVGALMLALEPRLRGLHSALLLEPRIGVPRSGFLAAGVLGAWLHVLLDAPLYSDIRPFYPVAANPLFNPALAEPVYSLCGWLFLAGLLEYAAVAALELRTRRSARP